jgi:hypothetical protein
VRFVSGVVVVCLAAACGYASVDGDPLTNPISQPRRSLDAGTDAEGDGGTNQPIASTDAGMDAMVAPPETCNVNDLALCFAFEGKVSDQSAAPIVPLVIANVTFAPGKAGKAAVFGADSALRFAPNASFELPAAAATIEAWIKRENVGADAVVFDDDGRFSLTINAAGSVWCKSSGGALVGLKAVPVDQWAHVACVIDGGTMRVYVNGVEDVSGPGAIGSAPELAAAIGGNSPDGEPFLGLIDSFRVFRVARTPAQIAAAAAP